MGSQELENVAEIELQLLRKYQKDESIKWLEDLIQKIKNKPEEAWLIEIKPENLYTY